jgi:acyl carrier protein
MSDPKAIDSEILERFAGIVATSLRIGRERVTPEAYLSDLGAESLDLLEITMEVEDEFGIIMPQKDVLQAAQEVVGPDVLVRDGLISEDGVRLLRSRLPAVDHGALVAGMPVADVNRIFERVGTWLRLIQGLIDHAPTACPSCAGALSKALAGRQRCLVCATEIDLPAGDDLNRRWVEEYLRREQALTSTEDTHLP